VGGGRSGKQLLEILRAVEDAEYQYAVRIDEINDEPVAEG
jgi:hypothetical protein